ncbi:mRNA capping enzyme, catalytic domain-containing protein [Jimgerdemannia flammicorona]|uniref:mRNA capping enzyme, catalytic domain-containing protein n=1 Tax=Jimgerdemannia flammicorona TaxID=994334 RepID=A0A433QNM6_9FUNG|nr:mRNA capping enzyme, catalytic domain-containing protein [Jimgerdemannia flammicorona]
MATLQTNGPPPSPAAAPTPTPQQSSTNTTHDPLHPPALNPLTLFPVDPAYEKTLQSRVKDLLVYRHDGWHHISDNRIHGNHHRSPHESQPTADRHQPHLCPPIYSNDASSPLPILLSSVPIAMIASLRTPISRNSPILLVRPQLSWRPTRQLRGAAPTTARDRGLFRVREERRRAIPASRHSITKGTRDFFGESLGTRFGRGPGEAAQEKKKKKWGRISDFSGFCFVCWDCFCCGFGSGLRSGWLQVDRKNALSFVPNVFFPRADRPDKFHNETLMDGELVLDVDGDKRTSRFLVFDLMVLNGTVVTQRSYSTRLGVRYCYYHYLLSSAYVL